MKKYKALLQRPSLSVLRIILPCIFILGISGWISGTHSQVSTPILSSKKSAELLDLPRVLVQSQPNTPLYISPSTASFANPLAPEISYLVVNVSTKHIRAYNITYEIKFGTSTQRGAECTNIATSNGVLRPGQSSPETLEGGIYSEPVRSIQFSVDFVEFTDGTRWGPDTYKFAEKLDGMRAGARAATKHLNEVLKTGGLVAVLDSVVSDNDDIAAPPGHSSEWEKGFHDGKNSIRASLRHTYRERGLSEIDIALKQPFDASDRK